MGNSSNSVIDFLFTGSIISERFSIIHIKLISLCPRMHFDNFNASPNK